MLSKYENGIHEPSAGTVYCLANIFGISPEYITCKTDIPNDSDTVDTNAETASLITVYARFNPCDGGEIEAGTVEFIPSGWLAGGHEFFGLRIKGSELAPRYYDGDIVIIERRSKVPGDRVGLVTIGAGNAFLCHVVRKRNGKAIIPLNRKWKEKFYTTEQLEESDVRIIGSAVQVRRME